MEMKEKVKNDEIGRMGWIKVLENGWNGWMNGMDGMNGWMNG